MRLGYLSMDELNQSLVARWGEREGIEVECLGRVARTLDASFDVLLLDLDHTTSEWVAALARRMTAAGRACCPVAVHGYGAAVDAFRSAFASRALTVRSQLQAELLRDLARAVCAPGTTPVDDEPETLTWINLA
jgi:hypothetical protein